MAGERKRESHPPTYRASYQQFEAFGYSKLQAKEAVKLGVLTWNTRNPSKDIGRPEDDDIVVEELKLGKPMMNGKAIT